MRLTGLEPAAFRVGELRHGTQFDDTLRFFVGSALLGHIYHKQYKTNALYSLGVLCYNDGANILKKAAPLANSDADKYAAEKAKADGRFKEALDYLEEAAKISPENENVKKMLPQVKAVMK